MNSNVNQNQFNGKSGNSVMIRSYTHGTAPSCRSPGGTCLEPRSTCFRPTPVGQRVRPSTGWTIKRPLRSSTVRAPARSVFVAVSNRVIAKVFPFRFRTPVVDRSISRENAVLFRPSPAGGFVGGEKKRYVHSYGKLCRPSGDVIPAIRDKRAGAYNGAAVAQSGLRATGKQCVYAYIQSKRPGRIPRRRRIVRFVSARHRQNGNTSQWRAVFVMEKSRDSARNMESSRKRTPTTRTRHRHGGRQCGKRNISG